MKIQAQSFDTLEQFQQCLSEVTNTDARVLQLSGGKLNLKTTLVDLGGVLLEWNRIGARIRSRETYRGFGLILGFILESPKPFKSFGHEIDGGYAVVYQSGEEVDYVAPTGVKSLVIYVDANHADLLGWSLRGSGLWHKVPTERLRRLTETCRSATRVFRLDSGTLNCPASHAYNPPMSVEAHWRARILTDMEPVLEPWLSLLSSQTKGTHGTRAFVLVKEVEQFFAQQSSFNPLAIEDLVSALGVSRRTLFRAFRDWLGVGAHAYLTLMRLHRLRDLLLAGSPADTSVTKLASELGFSHLGRLSVTYREHFGEHPSDTLRRKRV